MLYSRNSGSIEQKIQKLDIVSAKVKYGSHLTEPVADLHKSDLSHQNQFSSTEASHPP